MLNDKIKLIKVEPCGSWGDNPYSMLTFDVNGKTKKYGLSDSILLSLLKEIESQCSIPGVQPNTLQSNPTSVLSGRELHSVHQAD